MALPAGTVYSNEGLRTDKTNARHYSWRAPVIRPMVPVRHLAKNPLLSIARRLRPIKVILTKGLFF
jgi:hypothetical protein